MPAATLIVVFNQLVHTVAVEGIYAPAEVGAGGSYAALLGFRDTWAPNADDDFIATATGAGLIELTDPSYARQPVVLGADFLDDADDLTSIPADVVDFGAVSGGEDYDTLVIAMDTGDPSTSWLGMAYDLGAQTTDGSGITATPDTGGLVIVTGP